jgi:hypothetical protein
MYRIPSAFVGGSPYAASVVPLICWRAHVQALLLPGVRVVPFA